MKIVVIANCFILAFYDLEAQIQQLKAYNGTKYGQYKSLTIDDLSSYAPHLLHIDQTNLLFTLIYLVESILAGITYGVIVHKKAYLRIGWSWIDVCVIAIG
jgi:hypothetical protein